MNQVLSKDGTVIAFDLSGTGPAVVLVGGAFQYRAIDPPTAHLAALLAEQFTVFHYDRRGRGESSDTPPYAVEREMEDLEALIQEAGGSACVFGMSSGGVLALGAAARGLAITKLALYEPPFNSGDERARAAAQHYSRELTALLSEGRRRARHDHVGRGGLSGGRDAPDAHLAALRGGSADAGLRRCHHGRWRCPYRTAGIHHGPHAGHGWGSESRLHAGRCARGGTCPARCGASDPGRANA